MELELTSRIVGYLFIGLVARVRLGSLVEGRGFRIVSIKNRWQLISSTVLRSSCVSHYRIPSALADCYGRWLTFLRSMSTEDGWWDIGKTGGFMLDAFILNSDAPSGKHACSSDHLTGPKLGSTWFWGPSTLPYPVRQAPDPPRRRNSTPGSSDTPGKPARGQAAIVQLGGLS